MYVKLEKNVDPRRRHPNHRPRSRKKKKAKAKEKEGRWTMEKAKEVQCPMEKEREAQQMEEKAKAKAKKKEKGKEKTNVLERGGKVGEGAMGYGSPMAVEHGSKEGVEEKVPMSIHAAVDNLNAEVQTVKTPGARFHNGVEMQAQVLVDVG